MTLVEARTLFEYNDWANIKLVGMISKAYGEETDLLSSRDEVLLNLHRATIHIIGGAAFWRTRVRSDVRSERVAHEMLSTSLDLGFAFRAESARFWSLFDSFENDEKLLELIEFNDFDNVPHSLRLDRIRTHLSMHSVYHRGQITGMLMCAGHKDATESTDILYFYESR